MDSVKDIASSSSPGPDGLHGSIFKNFANVLAKPLSIIFRSMFDVRRIVFLPILLFIFIRVVINYHQVIIDQFHELLRR